MQTLKFSNDGELILIRGENGKGKSSLLESIDFSIFNIVRGKNIKRVPTYVLPNRFNKNLEVEINFYNWLGNNIVINRKLAPKGIKFLKDDVDMTDKFELMTQQEKDDIIGLEYNTYKSLVSLNLADFANFINLDAETKRKLLNKLFNLDEFDNYLSITKEILKPIYKQKEELENRIIYDENMISSYKESLDNIIEQSKEISTKIEIKEKMLQLKGVYDNLKKDISELKYELKPLNDAIRSGAKVLEAQKNKLFEDDFEINDLFKKLEIFENGHCPLCGTDLITDFHKKEHKNLNDEYSIKQKELLEFKSLHSNLKKETINKNRERKNILTLLDEKNLELSKIKLELSNLKMQYDNSNIDSTSVTEINKNIKKLENDITNTKQELDIINDKIIRLEKILNVLSERGIRQGIIDTIVDPINEHLSDYLVELEATHNVKLNNQFDALIKDRYEEVHIETLSTGEARKINIAIALSYMEMILKMNKKTNILFMDEVFASVDPENINLILKVLKKFSVRNKINIIIVNHSNFDMTGFDRVININKEYGFSQIEEISNN